MYCGKCGLYNKDNAVFCEHCGNKLIKEPKKKSGIFKYIIIGILILVIIFIIVGIANIGNKNKVYISDETSSVSKNKKLYNSKDDKDDEKEDDKQDDDDVDENEKDDSSKKKKNNNGTKKSPYTTSIVIDNYYYTNLESEQDADNLIVKDSEGQKDNTEEEIKKIEDEIITKYKVKAVNFGEMDVETAKGVANAFKYIYENYPSARNELSNISIGNLSISQMGVIAFFGPAAFASSNTSVTGYPRSYKTLMCLSSRYFLNPKMLDNSVKQSSEAGHFPKNTNRYATVVHESGHFLTMVATMKKYGLDSLSYITEEDVEAYQNVMQDWSKGVEPYNIIQEAYKNYQTKYNDTSLSFDDFRASISEYAMAKDENGNYIYHETVAEAFHDVYINKDNAAKASIEIVNVLNERLK